MKVLLCAINAKFVHTNLAVRYLREYTKDIDYKCDICEFSINDRIEKVLELIMKEKPEIIAFSCYIWNIEMIIKLANLIKKVDRHIEILYGGPEVSYDSESFLLNNVGEYVIQGEGEETFREFILYKNGDLGIEGIKGIYYREGNEIKFNGNRSLMNMDKLPFPYREEESFEHKIIYYESMRGCPFSCKYCLSSTTQGVRFKNIELVKQELLRIIKKGVPLVKFVDRTFNCNKKYSREIWTFLMDLSTDTTFHFEISADLFSEEDIELLSKAPKGRFQFEIGVQTTNPKVITNIDRTMNVQELADIVKKLKRTDNINLHLDLIAGLPEEDFQSFINSFNEVFYMGGDEIQLGFLKMLKGSLMREETEKWGIIYSDYAPYEILRSNDISYDELITLKKVEEIVDRYYNSGNFRNVMKFMLDGIDNPFNLFFQFSQLYESMGYFNRNISLADYYKIILDFNKKYVFKDEQVLKDLIKYDFIRSNKKNWIPEFLSRDIAKDEERELKLKFASKNNIETLNRIHLEDFSIDIPMFLNNGLILERRCFYVFLNSNKLIEEFYYI
ncbi:B12-binding domain-containing radical SAM protein [Clostridium sp. 19966]|uniref:B12-binding domain-containing radical SAM protein n=1 Tax=Clostridium sp. 19966 TaxID=2768166 RepID=UPI0028DEA31B|nr:B12-binding domain-containing radical SAM protein [Clostridium sp. 19966]MDT8715216.1 B12-binding domain-containing radical SAM protein [Clostridium sp. 19966]